MAMLTSLVPPTALSERHIRARGPGGQHVNTSSTAVQLRLDLARSRLPMAVLERLRVLAGSRLTVDDEIVITSDSHRSLQRNREDAAERMAALILEARRQPRRRVPTKPTRGAKERRLAGKKGQGRKKALRQKPVRDT
ncbi:ribosome-associated protein [Natronocella acetinitrilica]|uniref:Ribosome-associated protein n=1 Tax=Natronocella acetinitrilica TaxID=414046 RepID=A0AAE3G6R0_9GAMM|nr:alternative ribosome rescue aminoacyl-tRNA hydrolase ArfB [Natronocella acetinitrilica]MCP1676064.1 ribosome-associated protein [Natronocella acetinitrilica]